MNAGQWNVGLSLRGADITGYTPPPPTPNASASDPETI